MAERRIQGWLKVYRRVEYSPVWDNHNAFRLLVWLLFNAAPGPESHRTSDGVVALARGDLFATYEEMAKRVRLSVDQVKRAFLFLRGLEVIDWRPLRRGLLVTIVNYRQYQDISRVEGEGIRDGFDLDRIATSTPNRTPEPGKTAQQKNDASDCNGKAMKEGENTEAHGRNDDTRTADRTAPRIPGGSAKDAAPPSSPRARAPARNEVQETKKLINPPTPFKKGGSVWDLENAALAEVAMFGNSEERQEAVLALWYRECKLAGVPSAGPEAQGKRNPRGARMLVDEYLGAARLQWSQLEKGIREILRLKKSDPKCGRYDLLTLANNPDNYCPEPSIPKQMRKKIRWRLECDVCGETAYTPFLPVAEKVEDQPCAKTERGCQGWMRVFMDAELEA